MALSLDSGGVVLYGAAGSTLTTPTLTVANAGDVIVVVVDLNYTSGSGAHVIGITGGGVTFTLLKKIAADSNGFYSHEVWTGYAAGTFSAALVVTTSASVAGSSVQAFGVSGAPSSSYFDTNGSLPAFANAGTSGGAPPPAADPIVISTTAANTMVIGTYRMAAQQNPTAGSGFTNILGQSGAAYLLSEYAIYSSAQASLSVGIGTGTTNANAGIIFAIVASGGAGVTGTLADNDAADAFAASGNSGLDPGTLADNDAADTFAGSGSGIVAGTMAAADAADTFGFAGAGYMLSQAFYLGASGHTNFYVVFRDAQGHVWNSGTSAYEAYNASNYANYANALTEQGATGFYAASIPALAVAALNTVDARSQVGGSAAPSDTQLGSSSAVFVDVTQPIPTTNVAQTHGDALNAARAQGFGKWVLSGTTLTLYAADGSTAVRTFTLDSGTAPTQRT